MTEPVSKIRWTTRSLEALKVNQRTDFTDPDTKGLVLRVTPGGTKTWSFLYVRKGDGKKRRVTLKEFPRMGLSEAREQATRLRIQVDDKLDPAGAAANYKIADTVGELLDQFLEQHPRPAAAWTKECKRIFNKDVRPLIGHVKLPDLDRVHVRKVVEEVRSRGATVTVNRTLAALRRAFSWAVSKDHLKANPALNLATDIAETSKDRSLSADEIKAFWNGLENSSMGSKSRNALRLILLTGQRPGEVCGARKSELDLEAGTWLIPSARAKNRQDHVVPLSELAKTWFRTAVEEAGESEFVFPSRRHKGRADGAEIAMQSHALSHAMRGSLKALGLTDNPATPHDLRRTVASHMARIGIADRHVARVLNHGTELRRTITSRVYIQHDFLPEKKQALEAWAAELASILGSGNFSNITSIHTAKGRVHGSKSA